MNPPLVQAELIIAPWDVKNISDVSKSPNPKQINFNLWARQYIQDKNIDNIILPLSKLTPISVDQKSIQFSNLAKVLASVIFLRIHNNTSEESTCGFHHNIQQYDGFNRCSIEENLPSEKLLSSSTPYSSNMKNICTPDKLFHISIYKYCHLVCNQWSNHT